MVWNYLSCWRHKGVFVTLQWRHNEIDGVWNRQPHDCLLNRSFTRRSTKASKLRVTGLCVEFTDAKLRKQIQIPGKCAPITALMQHMFGNPIVANAEPELDTVLCRSQILNNNNISSQPDNYYHMMTSSNGNIFRVTGPLCEEFTTQRPVTRSFDVFFDLCLNKRLGKQLLDWWFETPSRSLWRHCND